MSRGSLPGVPLAQRARVWIIPAAVATLFIGTAIVGSASAVVAKPAGSKPPGKPTAVSVEAAGSGELVVAWKKPTSGGEVGGYVTTATPGGKKCTTTKLTCTIKGLVDGKDYTISVVATGKGNADDSAAATAMGTPQAPALEITGSIGSSPGLTTAGGGVCSTWGIATKAGAGAPTTECQLVVAAILADGRIFTSMLADAAAGRAFSIKVRADASDRENLTLHLLRADGSYVGPVVLGTKSQGGKKIGLMSLAGLSTAKVQLRAMDLGPRTGATASAIIAAGNVVTGSITSTLCSGDIPLGAGRAGFRASCKASAIVSRSRVPAADGDLPASCTSWEKSGAVMTQNCFNDIKKLVPVDSMDRFISACAGAIGQKQVDAPNACVRLLKQLQGGGSDDGDGGKGDECTQAGGDADSDGVPDSVDVDDNGNGIVDMADPETDGSCTIEPTKGLRTRIGSGTAINYGIVASGMKTATQLTDDIDAIFERGDFGIGYYVHDSRLFPGALQVNGAMPAVWISCPGVAWCDPAMSPLTTIGTNVEEKNPESVLSEEGDNNSPHRFQWTLNEPFKSLLEANGSDCQSKSPGAEWAAPCWREISKPMSFGSGTSACNYMTYDGAFPASDVLAMIPGTARNFLWRSICDEKGMQRVVFAGGINPRLAKDATQSIRSQVSALDVLRLNYLLPGGAVGSIATTIGAYPITAPMIRSFKVGGGSTQSVAYTDEIPLGAVGKAIVISRASPTLTISFNRPQREQFPGETGTTGFHDLHGLNYGLQFEIGDSQFGCGGGTMRSSSGSTTTWTPSTAYTGTTGFAPSGNVDDGAKQLTPLRDAGADSPTEAPGVQTLTFTLDVVKCLRDRAAWLTDSFENLRSNEWSFSMSQLNLPDTAAVDGTARGWANLKVTRDESCISVNLAARGEARTGGTDNALQEFCLQFAPGTLSAP